ncbi:hypothetical protein Plo01_30190 [Planobispora longispora]|uniref:Uncharacterized protein n=1 Tax=Planobispora longispora TaxID=28887 RepID=A0A8J3RKI2_9ACTN|nr:hypothetical protein Plo01_30190 [Planobispora longispora]
MRQLRLLPGGPGDLSAAGRALTGNRRGGDRSGRPVLFSVRAPRADPLRPRLSGPLLSAPRLSGPLLSAPRLSGPIPFTGPAHGRPVPGFLPGEITARVSGRGVTVWSA